MPVTEYLNKSYKITRSESLLTVKLYRSYNIEKKLNQEL